MFRTERGSRRSLVIEDFRVPVNRSICRALLHELSRHLHRAAGVVDPLLQVSREDHYRIAENFEAFIFSDDDQFLVRHRWIAVEAAVARVGWSYTKWANLAQEIAAEEVFLRTGSAQAASEILHLPEDAVESIDNMLGAIRLRLDTPPFSGEKDLGENSGRFDASGSKGSIGGVLGVGRDRDELNHSESSFGGMEASTVGEGGRVGNDSAAGDVS